MVLLGPLAILSFLMNFISISLSRTGFAIFGRNGFIYGFKWIGTPVHEVGHALFAFLFGHKITGIKLFDPSAKDGSFGSVTHTYKSWNIYHEIGNLFIGIGPVLMCSISLYIITYFLFGIGFKPGGAVLLTLESFSHISSLKTVFFGLYDDFRHLGNLILFGNKTSWWKITLFFYLQFSIGSSITLSLPDIKSAFKGFIFSILIVFLFNLSTLWIGNFALSAIAKVEPWFSSFYFTMITALIINFLFLILFIPLSKGMSLVKGRSS